MRIDLHEGGPPLVRRHARSLATHLGASAPEARLIAYAAVLHDLAAMRAGVAADEPADRIGVLRHLSKLSLGASVPSEDVATLTAVLAAHHAHWDGTGVPGALRGDAIPLGARILAVLEAFNRSTRAGSTTEEALRALRHDARGRFDPEVVHALHAVLRNETASSLVRAS